MVTCNFKASKKIIETDREKYFDLEPANFKNALCNYRLIHNSMTFLVSKL